MCHQDRGKGISILEAKSCLVSEEMFPATSSCIGRVTVNNVPISGQKVRNKEGQRCSDAL